MFGMTVLTSLAWVVSCPLLHAACLRWILFNTSIGPCFAVAVASAPTFAASLIFGLLQGRGRVAATGVIEDGLDMSSYCVLSLLTAAFHILQAFALSSDFVSVGVYAAFTLLDEIICPWISSMFLRRPLRLGMIAGVCQLQQLYFSRRLPRIAQKIGGGLEFARGTSAYHC